MAVSTACLLEAKQGVSFLRGMPEVRKVILWGHSGGGTLVTAYQMIAEGGVTACRGTEKIHQCPDTLADLPPADGVILGDSNMGLGEITLLSVDPAVIDQSSGIKLDPSLDMYNPANGYRPDGSTYSEAFKKKFFAAQGAKNNEIIKLAKDRLRAIEAGKGMFLDDEIFVYPGGYIGANKLFTSDVSLLSDTKKPWPLVHADGSISNQIIHSVRVPQAGRNPSPFLFRGAIKTTVRGISLDLRDPRWSRLWLRQGQHSRRRLDVELCQPPGQRRRHCSSAAYARDDGRTRRMGFGAHP